MTNRLESPILPAIRSATKLFLHGPFGAGKTALALERARWLLEQERVRGDDIIILTPQRSLARPYHVALRSAALPPGSPPLITTVASLVRHAAELYWPVIARDAGFARPEQEPTFLTLETSQYHMGRLVDEAVAQGAFDGIRVARNRVISQVLDNLNKAALNRFTIDETYARLELAVPLGEQRTARLNALRAAQSISREFRALCLEEALLDFSLQVTLFNQQVLTNEWSRAHLFRSHRHLIFDNVEEDTRTAHDLVSAWLPSLESALLLMDDESGFRVFLGADPAGAQEMLTMWADATGGEVAALDGQHIMDEQVRAFHDLVEWETRSGPKGRAPQAGDPLAAMTLPQQEFRFYPQMIDWAVEESRRLVQDEGIPPGEIALLAPFVSDALRFSLETGLARHAIKLTTHRPSRALEDEPAARTLITLAALAHPDWGIRPAEADVTAALTLSIEGLDPVRGHLLGRVVYPPRRRTIELGPFDKLETAMQERITFRAGERYARLRDWIYAYRAEGDLTPLDQFFARFFGEVLSQPGFGLHNATSGPRVAKQLVESARKFRWALADAQLEGGAAALGREYVRLFDSGALSALYVPGWQEPDDAVFLAPAYTFLMRNRPVSVQFWLDVGSSGWWERLYQPLTHPYVLAPGWPRHEVWNDFYEFQTRQDAMRRLLLGLIRRTRSRIYVGMSSYSESGFEQQGPLLSLINRLLAKELARNKK
ncbi:MAG: hypothetical protein H6642_02550 [Caldilineaceae bacterium]|nr:hypothetical protein [Caldilineaceae bacterium]